MPRYRRLEMAVSNDRDRCPSCGADFAEFPEMRHDQGDCPGPECTCYEVIGGHQPGCPLYGCAHSAHGGGVSSESDDPIRVMARNALAKFDAISSDGSCSVCGGPCRATPTEFDRGLAHCSDRCRERFLRWID